MGSKKDIGYDWPRHAVNTLIALFEENSCLYVTTDPSYQNRPARENALQKITTEFNLRTSENLTVVDVKTKIKRLRTQYNAEVNKMKKSAVSGSGTDDLYVSKWWCFEKLNFLQQGIVVAPGASNLEQKESELESTLEHEVEPELIFDGTIEELEVIRDEPVFSLSPIPSTSRCSSASAPQKRKRSTPVVAPERLQAITGLLNTAASTLRTVCSEKPLPESQNDLFGRMIGQEMNAIVDEEILDDLKQTVMTAVYAAKKRQREKESHN